MNGNVDQNMRWKARKNYQTFQGCSFFLSGLKATEPLNHRRRKSTKMNVNQFANLVLPIIDLVCTPKILHNNCLQFLLNMTVFPRKIKNNAYWNFWVQTWYILRNVHIANFEKRVFFFSLLPSWSSSVQVVFPISLSVRKKKWKESSSIMTLIAFEIIKQCNDRGKATVFMPKIWKYFVEHLSPKKIG